MKVSKYILTILLLSLITQSIYCQCNCQTLNRSDASIKQCSPSMVSSDNQTEIGLAVATNGAQKYLTLTIRFFGAAQTLVGDLTIWLEDGTYFSLEYVNGGLVYIDNSQVANAVFILDTESITKFNGSNLKTVAFSLTDGLRRSYKVNSNNNIVKQQLNCI